MLWISRYFYLYCLVVNATMTISITSASVADDKVCSSMEGCMKCDKMLITPNSANGTEFNETTTGYRCIKCKYFIVIRTRQCVKTCPFGYSEDWSTQVDYIGRICKEKTSIAGIPLSGQKFAVMLGVGVGAAVCVVIVVCSCMCVRYKRKKGFRKPQQDSPLSHLTGTHRSQDSSEESEKPEYLKQLSCLRADAPIFLAMLNETRRQVRELKRQNTTMHAYRPVLKDLSRILILLNKSEEDLHTPPADWETLLAWGERVLRRYKRQNPEQVAQLLGFTQLPMGELESSSVLGHSPYPTQLTTFPTSNANKKQSAPSSNEHLQQLAISAFDAAYNNRKRNRYKDDEEDELAVLKKTEVCAIFNKRETSGNSKTNSRCTNDDSIKTSATIIAEWHNPNSNYRRSYYSQQEEDDFYTLGFRPQDEITTEL